MIILMIDHIRNMDHNGDLSSCDLSIKKWPTKDFKPLITSDPSFCYERSMTKKKKNLKGHYTKQAEFKRLADAAQRLIKAACLFS